MPRYDLPRVLREAEQDLFRFSAWCGKVGDAMKFIGPCLALALIGISGYLTRGLWININVPLLAIILLLTPYLVILIAHSRQPELKVGELLADETSGMFDVKVTNLGPGKVQPTVTITHLRDGNGKQFPNAPESYRPREAHWRHAVEPNWNPHLKKDESAHAGLLYVIAAESNCPYMCTYANEQRSASPLWSGAIPLNDQQGIQLSFIASYKRSSGKPAKGMKFSYLITPDETKSLRYKIDRVSQHF